MGVNGCVLLWRSNFTSRIFPCRLIADEGFRKDLVSRIAKVGVAIEEALGSAQDIEGAVEEDGSITVVQTRPQM